MGDKLTAREGGGSRGGYRFVVLWAALVLLLYALGGYFGSRKLRGYAAETGRSRQAKIEAPTTEPIAPATGAVIPSGAKPVDVQVALRMNRVGEFALKESGWTADFDVSFGWTGDAVSPGESFLIVNGQILQREKGKSYERGGERYEEYHVTARMTKPFDASRFPFGDETLIVQVEDATHGLEALRYVADERGSSVGSEALPRNVKLARILAGVKVRPEGPVQSEPGVSRSTGEAHSRFFFAMLSVPDSFGIFVKLFQALFASVAVAFIVFFIKPIHVDPRFGLPVGGFFAAVANNVFVSSLLPHSDRLTLVDMVNATGLITIFLILVQSAVSLYIFDTLGQERLSRFFDKVAFAVMLVSYVAVNLVLPLAARPS